MTEQTIDGLPLPLFLDKQRVMQLMITLPKMRYGLGISRAKLAGLMQCPIQQIHDFDERKTPWQSITISWIQRYAYALGVRLDIAIVPQGKVFVVDNYLIGEEHAVHAELPEHPDAG